MAGQKEISVGIKFTGDDAGFQRVVKDIGGSIGSLKTQFSTLATSVSALAVIDLAKKGFEAYSKVMNSTEGSAETLEQQISLLDGAMSGLMRTITTGSWESLISNMTQTAKATREAKIATQEFEHASAGRTITRGGLMIGLQEARVNAQESTNPRDKSKYLTEAVTFQKQITALNVSEIAQRLNIDEEYYQKVTGNSKEYFDYFLKMVPILAQEYDKYFGTNSVQMEATKIRIAELEQTKNWGTITPSGEEELHQLKLMMYVMEDYIKIQDDFSKKGQWDSYIRGIGEMKEAAAAGEKALVRLVKQLTIANEAIKPIVKDSAITSVNTKSPYNISNKGFANALHGMTGNMPGLQKWNTSEIEQSIRNREQGIKLEEEMTREMELQTEVARGLDSVLGNVFANAKDGWQAMADAAIESIERIVAELLAKQAVLAIMNILFPGTGSGMSEGLSLISSFAPNMAMGHFASGTNFAPGGMAIVGERGPELVNLPRGSQVIPSGRNRSVQLQGRLAARDMYIMGELYQNMLNTNT